MRANFTRIIKNLYSQQPKQNTFKLPIKGLLPISVQASVEEHIKSAWTCNILAVTFKDNIECFTAENIYMMFNQLRAHKLEIDYSFHSIIAPISLEYIKVFNREQSYVFYEMAMTLLELEIDCPELWAAILDKLDNENIYRYIPLFESSLLLEKLLDTPSMRDHSLTRKLISVIYQQKLFYSNYHEGRLVISRILKKLEDSQSSDPQLTEAYKQLV